MRIALLISGYLRSFDENINNIKKNIIQDNDCDIYIHITKDIENDKYMNKKISIEKINEILKPKLLFQSNNLNMNNDNNINNILNQNYKIYILNEKRKVMEKIEKIKYDIVIKIRPDILLSTKLDYNIDRNYIYIPKDSKIDKTKLYNNNDPYICDIIAYGSPDIMNMYCNLYLEIDNLIKEYGLINETILYYYLITNKINYKLIDIDYFVVLSLCNTIAITGDSGTGKTTLSNYLKLALNNSFVLECDRYHKWERGNNNWKKFTHLNPAANYLTKMEDDVFALKIGNNIYQIDYNHNTGKFTDKQLIESTNNIIVTGLHTLYNEKSITNVKIYMDVHDNLRIPWKIQRDMKKRNHDLYTILETIESRKEDYNKYILPQKDKADIIINFYTNDIFNLDTSESFNPTIFLTIGIHNKFNISNILSIIKKYNYNITNNDKFININFEKYNNYYEIIVLIILALI